MDQAKWLSELPKKCGDGPYLSNPKWRFMQHKTVDLLCFEEIWEFNEEQQLSRYSPSKLSSDGSGFNISLKRCGFCKNMWAQTVFASFNILAKILAFWMMPTLVCEHCTKAIGGDCVGLIPSLA
jgi:hypothetical protein